MSGLFNKISQILERLNNKNPNPKPKSTIDEINKKCNKLFEKIYTRCRIDFGRELIELMDIKKHVAERCQTDETCTPVQEMLAIKIIELIVLYFNIADSLVSMQKIDCTDKMAGDYINNTKDKMLKIQELSIKKTSLMDEECGGAVAVMKALVSDIDTDILDPVMITSKRLVLDDDLAEKFVSEGLKWARENNLNIKEIKEQNIKVTNRSDGTVRVYLDGYEETSQIFSISLSQMFAPIENQRYAIQRLSKQMY